MAMHTPLQHYMLLLANCDKGPSGDNRREDLRQVLVKVTGQDFGHDCLAWHKWILNGPYRREYILGLDNRDDRRAEASLEYIEECLGIPFHERSTRP